jgi:hypothetical protein
MKKSQQRLVISYFSFKDWDESKIQKELAEILITDVDLQPHVSRSLTRLRTGYISCLDEQ